MEVKYNVCGPRRKEMVQAVSEALGGWSKQYLGVPSCSYQVGDFEITRNGTLVFADRTDAGMVEQVLEALAQAGFECEEEESPRSRRRRAKRSSLTRQPRQEAEQRQRICPMQRHSTD